MIYHHNEILKLTFRVESLRHSFGRMANIRIVGFVIRLLPVVLCVWSTSLIPNFRVADELPTGCAQLVEHRVTVRKVVGSNPDRTNTITEEKVLPL